MLALGWMCIVLIWLIFWIADNPVRFGGWIRQVKLGMEASSQLEVERFVRKIAKDKAEAKAQATGSHWLTIHWFSILMYGTAALAGVVTVWVMLT